MANILDCLSGAGGSIPLRTAKMGKEALLVERRTVNPEGVGSTPTFPANNLDYIDTFNAEVAQ